MSERSIEEDKAIAQKLLDAISSKPVVKTLRKGTALPPVSRSKCPDYSIKGKRYA